MRRFSCLHLPPPCPPAPACPSPAINCPLFPCFLLHDSFRCAVGSVFPTCTHTHEYLPRIYTDTYNHTHTHTHEHTQSNTRSHTPFGAVVVLAVCCLTCIDYINESPAGAEECRVLLGEVDGRGDRDTTAAERHKSRSFC